MKAALAIGPVAVAVNANQDAFMDYDGGIVTVNQCTGSTYNLDHAILAVGWGTDRYGEHLIVKNSWGSGWGESGYIRLQMKENDGACGVL